MDTNNTKNFTLAIGVIITASVFLSGAANYGYAEPKNGLAASILKFAQAVDETISPETRLVVPNVAFPQDATGGGGGGDFHGGSPDFESQGNFEEEDREDFIDPREVKNALREIKDMKRELKRFTSSLKKVPNSDAIKSEIIDLSAKLSEFESSIKSAEQQGTGIRDVIEEFRSAELWEQINVLRSKVELPKQLSSSEKELKKLKKMAKQKAFQNMGLDMPRVESWVAETEVFNAKLREMYNMGNWEDLNAEMEDFWERGHPGEVMGTMYRMRDLYRRMKIIKDKEVRAAIEESLLEVKESFNNGDYRAAREIMDDYFDDLERLIMGAAKIGRRGGMSEEMFDENLDKVRELIENKLGEKLENQKRRREKENDEEMPPQNIENTAPSLSEGGGRGENQPVF